VEIYESTFNRDLNCIEYLCSAIICIECRKMLDSFLKSAIGIAFALGP
jgi:hypothetical protein